ncbi:hypothetical protein SprV_0902652700 [Sparganum proliferum]
MAPSYFGRYDTSTTVGSEPGVGGTPRSQIRTDPVTSLHSVCQTCIICSSSPYHNNPIDNLIRVLTFDLANFTRHSQFDQPIKHSAVHCISTPGPPVFNCPRRFASAGLDEHSTPGILFHPADTPANSSSSKSLPSISQLTISVTASKMEIHCICTDHRPSTYDFFIPTPREAGHSALTSQCFTETRILRGVSSRVA